MAAPPLKNPKEVGGDFDVIFNLKVCPKNLCHVSLTIFADFWDMGGQVPQSSRGPPLKNSHEISYTWKDHLVYDLLGKKEIPRSANMKHLTVITVITIVHGIIAKSNKIQELYHRERNMS